MEENTNELLAKSFKESRQASENYLEYISQQGEEQQKKTEEVSCSLDSVIEDVRSAGVVSAFAAQESLQSHKIFFSMLKLMSKSQYDLAKLVVDIKQYSGVGSGESESLLGSFINGGATSGTLSQLLLTNSKFANDPKIIIGAIIAGGIINASDKINKKMAKEAEQKRYYPIIRNALDSSYDAVEYAERIYDKTNDSLLTRDQAPEMVYGPQEGGLFDIQPELVYGPQESDTTKQNNGAVYSLQEHSILSMQPQSVTQYFQYPTSSNTNTSERVVNINMKNEFIGNMPNSLIDTTCRLIAQQISDKLNAGYPVYSAAP